MSRPSPIIITNVYKRIRDAALRRDGRGVRLSATECSAIYWGDQAIRDAIDQALAADEGNGRGPNREELDR